MLDGFGMYVLRDTGDTVIHCGIKSMSIRKFIVVNCVGNGDDCDPTKLRPGPTGNPYASVAFVFIQDGGSVDGFASIDILNVHPDCTIRPLIYK
jgi:hypothetical protein